MLARTRYFPQLLGTAPPQKALPTQVDLRGGFLAVLDQGQLGSCTANAAAGLIRYFELVAIHTYVDPSRLFIYKTTRNLVGATGDTGAFLRTTMEALKLFGAPPESVWPYNSAAAGFNQLYDVEPTPFCYAYARNYAAVEPFRLDPLNVAPSDVLTSVKTALAAGFPSIFGFPVYPEFETPSNGNVPYPAPGSQTLDGHAIVAVGYDDNHTINGRMVRSSSATPGERTGALWVTLTCRTRMSHKAWRLIGGQWPSKTGWTQGYSIERRVKKIRNSRAFK